MTLGVFASEADTFPQSEQAIVPGGPARPPQSFHRRIAYALISLLLGLTAGLGSALVVVNAPYLLGAVGAEANEFAWVTSAYVMANVGMNLLLVRLRQQYGLRPFAMIALIVFSIASLLHLFVHGLTSAIVAQALFGIVAGPLTTLTVFYMLVAMPPKHVPTGLIVAITLPQAAIPLARTFSSELLAIDDWQALYLLESGLALVCLGAVALVRLPPNRQEKAFQSVDLLTFVLFSSGFALVAAVFGLGRLEWWTDRAWLGWALAAAIPLIGAAFYIERARATPLIDLAFITAPQFVRLLLVLLVGRIVLAEQSTLTFNILITLGVTNDELRGFSALLTLATFAGGLVAGLLFKPERETVLVLVAFVLIAISAFVDSNATVLTRQYEFYATQMAMAFATAFYIGPLFLFGINTVVKAGGKQIASFVVLLAMTQSLGGLIAASLLGTLQVLFEKADSLALIERVHAYDPQVATRIAQYSSAIATVVTDPAQRQAEAVGLLQQASTLQANVLGFNAVARLVAALAGSTALYLAALMLRRALLGRTIGGEIGAIKASTP